MSACCRFNALRNASWRSRSRSKLALHCFSSLSYLCRHSLSSVTSTWLAASSWPCASRSMPTTSIVTAPPPSKATALVLVAAAWVSAAPSPSSRGAPSAATAASRARASASSAVNWRTLWRSSAFSPPSACTRAVWASKDDVSSRCTHTHPPKGSLVSLDAWIGLDGTTGDRPVPYLALTAHCCQLAAVTALFPKPAHLLAMGRLLAHNLRLFSGEHEAVRLTKFRHGDARNKRASGHTSNLSTIPNSLARIHTGRPPMSRSPFMLSTMLLTVAAAVLSTSLLCGVVGCSLGDWYCCR